jgi:hypothetical protein
MQWTGTWDLPITGPGHHQRTRVLMWRYPEEYLAGALPGVVAPLNVR